MDTVVTRRVNALGFTDFVARFVKYGLEWDPREKANLEKRFIQLAKTVNESKSKPEDGIPTTKVDFARSPNSATNISDDKT